MRTWWNENRKGLLGVLGGLALLLAAMYGLTMLGDDAGATIQAILLMAVLALGYFVPTVIAASRKHHNLGAIIAVNVLLGWTFIGWVVALVWSLTEAHPTVTVQQLQAAPVAYQVGDVANGYRYNGQEWQPLS